MTLQPLPLLACLLALAACDGMNDQPRYDDYEESSLFPDGKALQHPPEGTVSRGAPAQTAALQTRPPMDRALLERGKERYAIFCVPCHDPAGYGNGRIPSRGFPTPPSFHSERLRNVDPRHIVDVITDGYGVMYPYAGRVPPRDRWAIAAYVKALQISQDAPERLLSAQDRHELAEARP
ncbi:c-type cytochrome [Martelella sp. AMO21009]